MAIRPLKISLTARLLLRMARLCTLALCTLATLAEAQDTRQVFNGESSPWLQAVGKLQVPGQRLNKGHTSHYIEDCSATLLARPGRDSADIILTAWHCLERYGDLSRPILFSAQTLDGNSLQREARRLADGGGMHSDWAILRLRETIAAAQLPPLQFHPALPDPESPVTLAGYSRDGGLGKGGSALTYDEGCAITGRGETNCIAFRGASGGPLVQLSGDGIPLLLGVLSQGDGVGISTFVPASEFRLALLRYLR